MRFSDLIRKIGNKKLMIEKLIVVPACHLSSDSTHFSLKVHSQRKKSCHLIKCAKNIILSANLF